MNLLVVLAVCVSFVQLFLPTQKTFDFELRRRGPDTKLDLPDRFHTHELRDFIVRVLCLDFGSKMSPISGQSRALDVKLFAFFCRCFIFDKDTL